MAFPGTQDSTNQRGSNGGRRSCHLYGRWRLRLRGRTRINIKPNATVALRGSQRQRQRKTLFVLARRDAAMMALRKGEKEKNKRRDPELGDGELVLSELRQWRT